MSIRGSVPIDTVQAPFVFLTGKLRHSTFRRQLEKFKTDHIENNNEPENSRGEKANAGIYNARVTLAKT